MKKQVANPVHDPKTHTVLNLVAKPVDPHKPALAPEASESTSHEVQMTFDKSKILNNQEFLYGADLQYSSFYDPGFDLFQQSLAIGHIPAKFRIFGNELQLVADNKRLFPSDVNHPEQLLSRFAILSQTDTTLTVSGAHSETLLAEVFEGTHTDTQGGLINVSGKPPRDQWIRSIEFVKEGDYILQETSVILSDGTIAEFMESIFPRSALAPGAKFDVVQMDPDNPVGADRGIANRYRYLPSEKNYNGEMAIAYVQHYDISPKGDGNPGTIDWWVTRNIPDEDLIPVQAAVEGWNRYFEKFKGIGRKVLVFRGRLPQGIHLGDPRFNVINWDSRLVAGAAYESQASDPSTGKQSHSLIYMPAAWIKIGMDYWTNGQFSKAPSTDVDDPTDGRHLVGNASRVRLACSRNIREAAALLRSGRIKADDVKNFGIRLLKDTLFHEVGHALGLAHDFKGSLSFNRDQGSIFSDSIMDYNDFEIELAAFDEEPGSYLGPQLEYDRQAVSALYNQSKDVEITDRVLAACNDAEADREQDGVDPLCIRYDIENDPTLSVQTAFDRITEASLKKGPASIQDTTLPQAIKNVVQAVLAPEQVNLVKTEEDLRGLSGRLSTGVRGAVRFYIVSGKASVARAVRTNVKSLLVFAQNILPAGYSELGMRTQAMEGVRRAVDELFVLPEAAVQAIDWVLEKSREIYLKTPYIKTLAPDSAKKILDEIEASVRKDLNAFTQDVNGGLPKVRELVLASLSRHEKVPYFKGKLEDVEFNIEMDLVGLLSRVVMDSSTRTRNERLAAAAALITYSGRLSGDPVLAMAKSALEQERKNASDNQSLETAEAVLAKLKSAK